MVNLVRMYDDKVSLSDYRQAKTMNSSANSIPDQAGTLGALLRVPYRRLQVRLYGELAARFPEIRAAHSAVFRHIAPEGSRLVDLAEQAELTKQSMAYLVNYLEKHGYLRLAAHPRDGRSVLVTLTPRGRAAIAAALEVSRRLEREAAARLGAEKLATLRRLLVELGGAFDPHP
jgi:DNA-binding MarR family transcriptional regulator